MNNSIIDRFNRHYEINPDTHCWEWQLHVDKDGYGTFAIDSYPHRAHRVSFEIFRQPIPFGVLVLHACDNPRCVNPQHLFLGSQLDNMLDKIAKGRGNHDIGEQCHNAKLTNADILKIREDPRLQRIIASEYHVGQDQISRIKSRKSWVHVA